MTDDPHDLSRFLAAQEPIYPVALVELRAGRKRSHWMWFVFPQLRGLGLSPMAHRYGIESRSEAEAYLADAVLGPRLVACTQAVLAVEGRGLREILGSPDDLKFGSCMTLFELVAGQGEPAFARALDRFCAGERDARTLALLSRSG